MENDFPAMIPILIVEFALITLVIISLWRIFDKAGQPGWAAIIPIYNTIVLLEVADKPIWWFVMLLIPVVNVVFWLLISLGLAETFSKGAGFGLGIFFLPFVFLPILAFSNTD